MLGAGWSWLLALLVGSGIAGSAVATTRRGLGVGPALLFATASTLRSPSIVSAGRSPSEEYASEETGTSELSTRESKSKKRKAWKQREEELQKRDKKKIKRQDRKLQAHSRDNPAPENGQEERSRQEEHKANEGNQEDQGDDKSGSSHADGKETPSLDQYTALLRHRAADAVEWVQLSHLANLSRLQRHRSTSSNHDNAASPQQRRRLDTAQQQGGSLTNITNNNDDDDDDSISSTTVNTSHSLTSQKVRGLWTSTGDPRRPALCKVESPLDECKEETSDDGDDILLLPTMPDFTVPALHAALGGPMADPAPHRPRAPRDGAPRPNIVMLLTDDQGWANVGYHSPHVKTPTMDKLATDGVILERHYAEPFCGPSRNALLTGRYGHHVPQFKEQVSRGITMFPAKLQQVGYSTHFIGKWDLGLMYRWHLPSQRGFNSSFGFLDQTTNHMTRGSNSHRFGCSGTDLWRNGEPAPGYQQQFGPYIFNDEAQRILHEHHEKQDSNPFFIYLALHVMHGPAQRLQPSEFAERYNHSYNAMFRGINGLISAADDVLYNVTKTLKELDMWTNTLVLVASDNGGAVFNTITNTTAGGNNYPLRGGKKTYFEGGVRTVAFLSGGFLPKKARKTQRADLVHLTDWYPTFSWLAGADPSDDFAGYPALDGHNMWPYLSGEVPTSPRKTIMFAPYQFQPDFPLVGAIIVGRYKYIFGKQLLGFWQGQIFPNRSEVGVIDGDEQCSNGGCLFDIFEDPTEHVNLAHTNATKLFELKQAWEEQFLTATIAAVYKYHAPKRRCEAFRDANNGFVGPSLSRFEVVYDNGTVQVFDEVPIQALYHIDPKDINW